MGSPNACWTSNEKRFYYILHQLGTSHSTKLGGARSYMEFQLTLDLIAQLNGMWMSQTVFLLSY